MQLSKVQSLTSDVSIPPCYSKRMPQFVKDGYLNWSVGFVMYSECLISMAVFYFREFVKNAWADIERFKEQKNRDLKEALISYAVMQISMCKKVASPKDAAVAFRSTCCHCSCVQGCMSAREAA